MRTIDTRMREADRIADEVSAMFRERPIAILIPVEEWAVLYGKEKVKSVDMEAELPRLDDLLKSDVIFVHYGDREERDYIYDLWTSVVHSPVIGVRVR